MRRKRLNHFGDALIGILTGYQVHINFKYIKENGQGEYLLDLITGKLTFGGLVIEQFPLFSNIMHWFNSEILNNNIDKNRIQCATLSYLIETITIEHIMRKNGLLFFRKQEHVCDIYNLSTHIKLNLRTDEADYSKQKAAVISI